MSNEYREQLPDQCPPGAAQEVAKDREVFRLVKDARATDEDFKSYRALFPTKPVGDECRARGVSVWTCIEEARNTLKLPKFRTAHICKVTLANGAGRVLQTSNPAHLTWWPYAKFNILSRCEVVS